MHVLIVVVRYKISLEASQTITSLSKMFSVHPELLNSFSVLIWDNSPSPLDYPQLTFPFEYRHTCENLGVSGAYNRAMEVAETKNCPWLLLLDHDTTLTDNFLIRMLEYSRTQEKNDRIAAIVPFLFDRERPISPISVHFYGNKPISPPFSGIYPKSIFAANSGTLMRVASLRKVGGYCEDFWLDLSDVVVFHRLLTSGNQVLIAGDLHMQHKVTNNDYDGSMSPERYINFSAAEGAYWDLYRNDAQNAIQTLRLFVRSVRQYSRYKNKTFAKITWKYFCQRLFISKKDRLQQWRRQSHNRSLPVISAGKVIG